MVFAKILNLLSHFFSLLFTDFLIFPRFHYMPLDLQGHRDRGQSALAKVLAKCTDSIQESKLAMEITLFLAILKNSPPDWNHVSWGRFSHMHIFGQLLIWTNSNFKLGKQQEQLWRSQAVPASDEILAIYRKIPYYINFSELQGLTFGMCR